MLKNEMIVVVNLSIHSRYLSYKLVFVHADTKHKAFLCIYVNNNTIFGFFICFNHR